MVSMKFEGKCKCFGLRKLTLFNPPFLLTLGPLLRSAAFSLA